MTTYKLTAPSRTTLRESVATSLRAGISVGDLTPGEHLPEVQLSESLGVSRATLREALRELQQEGLLVQDQRGRVAVRTVTIDAARDLFEVRLGLETIALRRICDLEDRSEAVAEMQTALEALQETDMSVADGLESDLALHRTMCALSGNATLLQAWTALSGSVRVTMVAAGTDSAISNMAHERHAPLIDIIRDGDFDKGKAFLAMHMQEAEERIVRSLPTE